MTGAVLNGIFDDPSSDNLVIGLSPETIVEKYKDVFHWMHYKDGGYRRTESPWQMIGGTAVDVYWFGKEDGFGFCILIQKYLRKNSIKLIKG